MNNDAYDITNTHVLQHVISRIIPVREYRSILSRCGYLLGFIPQAVTRKFVTMFLFPLSD